jgi:hypothetical protein
MEWMERLGEWEPRQIMFLDESACNERTGDRKYGWVPIGAVAHCKELLKYTEKWSVLPLYTMDGYIDWDIIKGSYNTEEFNEFVKSHVILHTNPWPGDRSVIIMDNCGIHRNEVSSSCLLAKY